MQNGGEVWQAFKAYIQSQLTKTEYDTWFSLSFSFVNFEANKLTVRVPNSFVRGRIEAEYIPVVKRAVQQFYGERVQLLYEIPSEEAPKATSTKESKPQAEEKSDLDSRLVEDLTFENFIEGSANKLALTVAQSIAKKPQQVTFNPWFIYGSPGVGKTHLINALGIKLKENFPKMRVLYVKAYEFRQQYTMWQQKNMLNEFLNFYQSIDVLIVDDIQDLNTEKTQQTFFHIFDHLHRNKRHLILVSDRPPIELQGFQERMLARFMWGMTSEILRPDLALRKAILLAKLKRYNFVFSDEVVDFIVKNVNDNVRNIEGVVNSLLAFSINDNCEIDLPLAENVVARTINLAAEEISLERIVTTVCKHFKVKPTLLNGSTRKKEIVQARQLAMYLCHKHTPLSFVQIGKKIGKRDHSTVMYACKITEQNIAINTEFRRIFETLEASLLK